MDITLKPYGAIVSGHVKDCDRRSLERELQFYDKQLYTRWNPKKNYGFGCWEIRRKPELKSAVQKCAGFIVLEYKELDIINHVLDVPYLSRDILGKIKSMDVWATHGRQGKNWAADSDYTAAKNLERIEKEAKADLKYNIKQNKKEWKDMLDLVASGRVSLAEFIKGIR